MATVPAGQDGLFSAPLIRFQRNSPAHSIRKFFLFCLVRRDWNKCTPIFDCFFFWFCFSWLSRLRKLFVVIFFSFSGLEKFAISILGVASVDAKYRLMRQQHRATARAASWYCCFLLLCPLSRLVWKKRRYNSSTRNFSHLCSSSFLVNCCDFV